MVVCIQRQNLSEGRTPNSGYMHAARLPREQPSEVLSWTCASCAVRVKVEIKRRARRVP